MVKEDRPIRQPIAIVIVIGQALSVLETVKASGPTVRIPGENSAKIAAERTSAGALPYGGGVMVV